MRIILFFDLPVTTSSNIREYNRFRKYLIKNGFLMMQQSVYCKLLLNDVTTRLLIENLKKHKPKEGLVQILTVTERQFGKMEYLIGEKTNDIIDLDSKLVVI